MLTFVLASRVFLHLFAGLCRVASLAGIEAQGWSLNPGRYAGVAERAGDDGDFKRNRMHEERERLAARMAAGQ